jgi:hypothetical protein
LRFLGVSGGVPRGAIEEGGQLVFALCGLGVMVLSCTVLGWTYGLRTVVTGEG